MQSKVLQAKCVYFKVSKYLFCFLNGEKIGNFWNKIKLNFHFSSVNFNLISKFAVLVFLFKTLSQFIHSFATQSIDYTYALQKSNENN